MYSVSHTHVHKHNVYYCTFLRWLSDKWYGEAVMDNKVQEATDYSGNTVYTCTHVHVYKYMCTCTCVHVLVLSTFQAVLYPFLL